MSQKDLSQKKVAAGDKAVRKHYQLNGHKSEQTLGDSEGQESFGDAFHGVTDSNLVTDLVTEQQQNAVVSRN